MALADELENLKSVFPPHPIDPTAAFAEWGGTYINAEPFREGVRGKRWTELESAFLEHHHDALVFLGPASISEFLPAYLSALVRREPALSALPSFLLSVLTRSNDGERFDTRFGTLTSEQRRAIARTLAAYEAELAGSSRQPDVRAALDSCWRTVIGDAR